MYLISSASNITVLRFTQVQAAVHGVTDEEVQKALQRNDWNPVRAEQQLKVGTFSFFAFKKIHIAFTHSLCSVHHSGRAALLHEPVLSRGLP